MNRDYNKEKLIKDTLKADGVKVGNVFYYDRVSSTMDIAAALNNDALKDYTIVVTDEQTEGRGRYKRKWYGSVKDCMFSIVFKNFDYTIPYSMIASLGVYDTLKPLSSDIRLKWINDVFWGSKKISGILTEEKNNRTIIGVGVNINSSSFPPSIADSATSLYLETGVLYNKMNYLINFVKAIINYISMANESNIEKLLKLWEDASKMRGVMVKVKNSDGEKYGIVQGINYKTGSLILKDGSKTIELYDGTLSFLQI